MLSESQCFTFSFVFGLIHCILKMQGSAMALTHFGDKAYGVQSGPLIDLKVKLVC